MTISLLHVLSYPPLKVYLIEFKSKSYSALHYSSILSFILMILGRIVHEAEKEYIYAFFGPMLSRPLRLDK